MPSPADQPAGPADPAHATAAEPALKPGDEAPAGSTGTGENVCRRCGGSGKVDGGQCPECKGTGVVTVVIGGA
jgi:hypothetical protein